MLYDTHIHTLHSSDSKMKIEDAIKKADQLGIGLIVTEHVDLNYPDPYAFRMDTNKYFRDYGKYRNDSVLLGVEIGLGLKELSENKELIAAFPFDYVLGSIHLVNEIDIYNEEYYQGKTKRQAFEEYFETMVTCVDSYDCIDSLGHIDYICRYARYPDRELYYNEFREHIDQVLKTLVDREKALEINTRRLDNDTIFTNLLPIYKRFSELGGRHVTIGSDAHNINDIGKNFSTAIRIAELANLRPIYFNGRKMQYLDHH